MTSTTKVVKDVILSNQSTWEPWFNNLKGSVPRHLWKFFDPEGTEVFLEPIAPVEPVLEPPPIPVPTLGSSGPSTRSTPTLSNGETPAQLAARERRFEKQLELFYKQHNIYSQRKREWDKIIEVQIKLQDRIQSSVAQQKTTHLDADLTVRQWLQALKASVAPPLATIQQTVRVKYQRFILKGLSEWPAGGPGNWIAKWEDLMNRARKYNVIINAWLTDVSTVWRPVPALATYFDTVETRIIEQEAQRYTVASVSAAIQQHWEQVQQGSVVKRTKPRTTRSAFATQEATLGDGDEAEPARKQPKPRKNQRRKREKVNANEQMKSRPRPTPPRPTPPPLPQLPPKLRLRPRRPGNGRTNAGINPGARRVEEHIILFLDVFWCSVSKRIGWTKRYLTIT